MVPLKRSSVAHRIHLPARQRISTQRVTPRSAQNWLRASCPDIITKRPMALKFAEYKPNGLSRMGYNVGGLPQA